MPRLTLAALPLALVLSACAGDGPAAPPDASGGATRTPSSATSTGTGPTAEPGPAEQARLDRQLRDAAWNDDVAVAQLLIALGADPDALDDRHDTPWLVTGVTGSVAMAEALLPANPDLTIRNRYGGLSPIPAAERGHVDYLRRVGWCGPMSTSTTSTTSAGPRCWRRSSSATAARPIERSSRSCSTPAPTRPSPTAPA